MSASSQLYRFIYSVLEGDVNQAVNSYGYTDHAAENW